MPKFAAKCNTPYRKSRGSRKRRSDGSIPYSPSSAAHRSPAVPWSHAAAAAAHLADEGCEIMLNYGLSGGISRVRRGDICVCTRFLEHDFDLSGIGYRLCEKPGQTYIYEADEQLNGMILSLLPGAVTGTAVTGDCFVNDGALREKLKTEFDDVCSDMETAAVAYVCSFAGIPFASVRRISDDAGADALTSYREMNSSGETVLSDFILECARAAARL